MKGDSYDETEFEPENELEDKPAEAKETSKAEELSGKLKREPSEDKLMHSVLENDKEDIDNGKLINESINMGINSFTPDMMFEQVTKNYQVAKQIYGERILKELCGYDSRYMDKNIKVPEFQKEIKKKIEEKLKNMKSDKLLDTQGFFTDKAKELAVVVLYITELDNLEARGMLGEKYHNKASHYGVHSNWKNFFRGARYKDIALKKSFKLAVRRGHKQFEQEDLKVFERQSKGEINIVYALDASGSMKGKKIEACKKSGIALAYKAISAKDKVGLLVFGSDIRDEISPTRDFPRLVKTITLARASKETDMVGTINRAIELFTNMDVTKHLILLTDAMPNIGKKPEEDTLGAVQKAKDSGITISLVGIKLNEQGLELGKKIVEIGNGRLYIVKDLENLDQLVLQDYYGL